MWIWWRETASTFKKSVKSRTPDCKSHHYKQQTLSSTTNMSTQAYQNVTPILPQFANMERYIARCRQATESQYGVPIEPANNGLRQVYFCYLGCAWNMGIAIIIWNNYSMLFITEVISVSGLRLTCSNGWHHKPDMVITLVFNKAFLSFQLL